MVSRGLRRPRPHAARIRGLLEISRIVREAGELPSKLERTAHVIADSLGVRTVAVSLYRPEWDDYVVAATAGEERDSDDPLHLPLRAADGHVLGILAVDAPQPTDDELEVLGAIAAHVEQAIESAQEAELSAGYREALEHLLRVSSQLTGTRDSGSILQTVCDAVCDALGFELAVIELADREADRYRPVAAAGIDLSDGDLQLDVPIAALDRIFDPQFEREGCFLVERDEALARVQAEPASYASTMNGSGPHAWNRHWLLAPLYDRDGSVAGFIWADDPIDRLIPARPRLQALRLLANQAATALDSATQFEALRDADELHSTTLDASPIGIVSFDAEGRVRTWNDAARRMFGYPDDDVIGREPPWLPPEARAGFRERFAEIVARGEVEDAVYVDLRADGAMIDVRTTSAPVRDAAGSVTGVVAAIEDITERKRLAKDLRQSQELYRAMVESSTDALALLGLDGSKLYLSPSYEALTGYSLDELYELPQLALVHPEDLDGANRVIAEALAGSAPQPYKARIRHKDGHWVWLEGVPAAVRNERGEPQMVLVIARDVSERLHQEDVLRQTQELYRTVVENSRDMILLLGLDGEVQYASPAQRAMLGYGDNEFVGTNVLDLVADDEFDEMSRVIAAALSSEGPSPQRARMRRRDSAWVDVEALLAPVLGEDGRPVGILGVVRDTRERRELEEQLRQSQKMEAIGQLAGGIAHDFNNLLTAIAGYGDLALAKLHSADPVYRNVEEMRRAGERAAALTKQLLAFSRRQVLQPKVLNLNEAVEGMQGMLGRVVGERIDFTTALASDLGFTRVDPGRIEQVLMNLVINARDAMPDGGRVTITTANVKLDELFTKQHVDATPGQYVMLAVGDTGVGMDRETLDRVFDPFFTTKPAGHGTGLGLSTVYGIVKQTGGQIWAYSEPGRGATFKVYLPRVWERAAEREERLLVRRTGGSETVLLVEDEEIVRTLVREMLEDDGYTVLAAASGGEALELACGHAGPIDVLVTDVIMPGLSGQQLAARLVGERPGVRVLFTSGYAEEAIATHGVLRPGTAFLEKPFTALELASTLRQLLDSATPGGTARLPAA